jgi:chaperonin GroEL
MKLIVNTLEVREKVLNAVKKISDPVVQTISPQGGNTLYEDSQGGIYVTNDGVTIAKQISSEDAIEDSIIRVIKYGALNTNRVAGDGTSTTILLTSTLIREGMKLLDDGMNVMQLKKNLEAFGRRTVASLNPIKVSTDQDILNIATISSGGDDEIAMNVLEVVKTAGDSGMVFINPSTSDETELIQDTGYVINSGMLVPELANDGSMKAGYEDVHVLVTDKRLYYEEECKAILSTAIKANIKNLVIIARDFIGKAPNFLIGNHTQGYINLLLVKHPEAKENDSSVLNDLAIYLGGNLVTEKQGKLVNGLTTEDFIVAKKVYATADKTVLATHNNANPKLMALVEELQAEKDKDKDNEKISRRLAVLTTGTVTVKVAGKTPIETQEKIFRYEDAINATRAAMKYGYLPGGGLALLQATNKEKDAIFKKFGQASVRQIAENCGKSGDYLLSVSKGSYGYNAKTDKEEDLIKAGVIDPYKVTQMAIENSISIAIAILTSRYIIVNTKEDDKQTTSTSK